MNARYRSLVLPLAVVAAACSTGVEANVDGAVNLGFAGFNSTSTPASGAAPQRIELGSDVIVLEKVELVLREIELKGNDDICSDDRAAADTAGTDDCNEVELGPMIVDLPLDGSVDHAIMAQVAEGVYAIRHRGAPFEGGNTTVVIGEREVLVVDACQLPYAARL
jgi:hypothetical protein